MFARRKPEDPLHHIGYVNAPDAELAGVYARSIYDEWAWIEMVVVPRAAITSVVEVWRENRIRSQSRSQEVSATCKSLPILQRRGKSSVLSS